MEWVLINIELAIVASGQQWIGTGMPSRGYELASDWQWIGTGSASG